MGSGSGKWQSKCNSAPLLPLPLSPHPATHLHSSLLSSRLNLFSQAGLSLMACRSLSEGVPSRLRMCISWAPSEEMPWKRVQCSLAAVLRLASLAGSELLLLLLFLPLSPVPLPRLMASAAPCRGQGKGKERRSEGVRQESRRQRWHQQLALCGCLKADEMMMRWCRC